MISLICAAYATYRLAVLLAEEEGPGEAAAWLRNRHLADDWIGRGLRCPSCISFWIALPMALAALSIESTLPMALWPLYWMAVAGAARWLWKRERND